MNFPVGFPECQQNKKRGPGHYLNQTAKELIRRNNANPFHEPVHTRFLDHLITIKNVNQENFAAKQIY
jgi:hypothetical protein